MNRRAMLCLVASRPALPVNAGVLRRRKVTDCALPKLSQ
jgi:hypothetical protein